MGNYTFDIMANSGGLDYSLVLTEYSSGEHGPKLGATFLDPAEIEEVFDTLSEDTDAARQKALDLEIWIPQRDKSA